MARFEVLGLDADRALIRSLAKQLAENGSDATLIRAMVRGPSRASCQRKAVSSPRCAVRPWSASISTFAALETSSRKTSSRIGRPARVLSSKGRANALPLVEIFLHAMRRERTNSFNLLPAASAPDFRANLTVASPVQA
jgi:hypothetical protein